MTLKYLSYQQLKREIKKETEYILRNFEQQVLFERKKNHFSKNVFFSKEKCTSFPKYQFPCKINLKEAVFTMVTKSGCRLLHQKKAILHNQLHLEHSRVCYIEFLIQNYFCRYLGIFMFLLQASGV